MSVAPSLLGVFRLGVIVASGHFLLFHLLFGLLLVLPRGLEFNLIDVPIVLFLGASISPVALLPLYEDKGGPAFFFPPGSAIPVGFASLFWAIVVCSVLLFVQRFIRYRPSARVLRFWRRLGFWFAVLSITWLFFGPVFGFAGDVMFGILDPARFMDGRFQPRPLRAGISVLACAASIFAAYWFLIVTPSRTRPEDESR